MTEIRLLEQLHSNTRKTRITYRALVNGEPAALKCYRKPLFGFIHWLRAMNRGKKIRRAGGPVPPIVFSGWVPPQRCFGFGTAFLAECQSLRSILGGESSRSRQLEIVCLLGKLMADLHQLGIEQPDGNLTNFLMGPDARIFMVDEDDIRVYPRALSLSASSSNLANVAARLPDEDIVAAMLNCYLHAAPEFFRNHWDTDVFWSQVRRWRHMFDSKRASREIAPRDFD